MIQTVTGAVPKSELGIVTPHEHIFIDLRVFFEKREIPGFDNSDGVKVSIGNLGVLNRDPYALRDNLLMDDYSLQKEEILRFKQAGGRTVVDATTAGIGRNPRLLQKIALETGLNVIMGAGYYVGSTYSEELKRMAPEQIAQTILGEIQTGIDGTGIKAGVIGEIGISEVFDDCERKVLLASAIAQKQTGLGILVHINPWTTNGLEAVDILLAEGVPPDKICVCHVDVECRRDYIGALLKAGVFIEFDNFGKEYYVDRAARRPGYGLFVSDLHRVQCLKALLDGGYERRILLSCDVCLKTLLRAYGGWGFDHLLVNVVPMMREERITQSQLDQMLIHNPADFLE